MITSNQTNKLEIKSHSQISPYLEACCLRISASQENEVIINWVNSQKLAPVVTCLGDGHDGVWNVIQEFAPTGERREILD